ncbi:MAG: hypothetical protein FJW32_08970 [Acidobacteria bacterium]|nr:hypothetical protein [Acidobacteriota bacterium]
MRPRNRGSALLFTLLASTVGSAILGLAIDAAALLAVRAQLQTAGELAADSISLERSADAGASIETLKEAARNSLDKNGFPLVTITLDAESLQIRHQADVFFLRMIRTEPVAVEVKVKL